MNKKFNEDLSLFTPTEELPPMFVGREEELVILWTAFFKDNAKVVGVVGSAGVGKTALILQYLRLHKKEFPGGVYHFPLISSVDVLNTALEFVQQSDQPILIVLEEAGSFSDSRFEHILSMISRKRPSARILFTSQKPISEAIHNLVDNIIKLEHDRFSKDSSPSSLEPFTRFGIIGPDGRPLDKNNKAYRQIVTDISEVSDELLNELSRNPELLHQLSARKFEEVVAEIIHRQGYEVTITPFSKDGGKDICAACKDKMGSFLYIVQCKKYAPNRPVGVELVRELYGVVQMENATAGIIATTSYFTKGARDLQSKLLYRISLKDYAGIREWLESVYKKK